MKTLAVLVLCVLVLCAEARPGNKKRGRGGNKGHKHGVGGGGGWSRFHGRPGSQLEHLYDDLFHHYNKNVRPCEEDDCKDAIGVSAPVNPLGIDMDFDGKEMRTHGWSRMQWTDTRLQWNPEDYGGISEIRVPQSKLWLPDIYLFNRFEHVSQEQFWNQDVLALVYSSGMVMFIPPSVLSTFCQFNKTDNIQSCQMIFGSWTYSKKDINLVNKDFAACDLSAYEGTLTDGWIVQSCTGAIHDKMYPCCPESYPSLTITITMKKSNSRQEETENIANNDGTTVDHSQDNEEEDVDDAAWF